MSKPIARKQELSAGGAYCGTATELRPSNPPPTNPVAPDPIAPVTVAEALNELDVVSNRLLRLARETPISLTALLPGNLNIEQPLPCELEDYKPDNTTPNSIVTQRLMRAIELLRFSANKMEDTVSAVVQATL